MGNETLRDHGKNLIIGSVSALSMLSDWGFVLFVVTFAFCWANLGRGRPPWRWFLLVVALPAVTAFVIYEVAVIYAIGWEFFLFDVKVTYLGRLGVGDYVDLRSVLERYRENSVVIWPAQGTGTLTLVEVLGVFVIKPLLNSGPAWILSMPALVCGTATIFSRIGWGRVAWSAIAVAVVLNCLALLPLPVLLPAVLALALGLARVHVATATQRLCGLTASLMLAIMVPATIFPGLTIGFSIGGGRPPFPLLEMSGAALFAEVVASGQLARWLTRLAMVRSPIRRLFASVTYGALALVSVLTVAFVASMRPDASLLGVSKGLALGIVVAMVGAPLIVLADSMSYIRVRRERLATDKSGNCRRPISLS